MITLGIDIGSNTSKGIILKDGKVAAQVIIHTAFRETDRWKLVFNRLLKISGLKKEDINSIVATGYGRITVPCADKTVTEITCLARGTHHLLPGARTIIDIGGQDCKIIALDGNGTVSDFIMNDRCSAGTGKFFEVITHALNIKINDLSRFYCQSKSPCPINSTCTVFAETEIISLLSEKHKKRDIAAGLVQATAKRIAGTAKGIKIRPEIIFTGGVAKNMAMFIALGKELDCSFFKYNFDEQLVGALGAALIAARISKSGLDHTK